MTTTARLLLVWVLCSVIACLSPQSASLVAAERDLNLVSGRRRALVIGNDAYQYAPVLQNAANDAKDLSNTLRVLGFGVDVQTNLDLRGLDQAIDSFIGKTESGDIVLFHFSGHGLEVDGENYLVPVDFELQDEADVKYSAYSASRIHDRLTAAGSKLNVIVLDACRNNGFRTGRSSQDRGLAPMNAAEGSYLVFATAPGSTASDNTDGRNGLFTQYLLNYLPKAGLSLDDIFNRVRTDVYRASGRRQLPWTSSSVIGEFYFVQPEGPVDAESSGAGAEIELEYWESIRDSNDPTLYEDYLKRYPHGAFVEIARATLRGTPRTQPQAASIPPSAYPVNRPEAGSKPINRSHIGVFVRSGTDIGIGQTFLDALNEQGGKKGMAFVRESDYDFEVTIQVSNPNIFIGQAPVADVFVASVDGQIRFAESKSGYLYRRTSAAKKAAKAVVARLDKLLR